MNKNLEKMANKAPKQFYETVRLFLILIFILAFMALVMYPDFIMKLIQPEKEKVERMKDDEKSNISNHSIKPEIAPKCITCNHEYDSEVNVIVKIEEQEEQVEKKIKFLTKTHVRFDNGLPEFTEENSKLFWKWLDALQNGKASKLIIRGNVETIMYAVTPKKIGTGKTILKKGKRRDFSSMLQFYLVDDYGFPPDKLEVKTVSSMPFGEVEIRLIK